MLRDLFSLFPAYAGVIPFFRPLPSRYTSFPRIRGGDPHSYQQGLEKVLLFPAYAGVILYCKARTKKRATFPRIRGGDPEKGRETRTGRDFSPHTRGLPKDPSQGFA